MTIYNTNKFITPKLSSYEGLPITLNISEWERLCSHFGIHCHADLADLQKIDYEAWIWGIKLEQYLTKWFQQHPPKR